jgi:hypothetical protein
LNLPFSARGVPAFEKTELAAASGRASVVVTLHNDAPAQGGRDEDVEERLVLFAEAELHLADGGRGSIVFHEHRHMQGLLQQRRNVSRRPDVVVGRLVRQRGRVRHVIRRRDTDAGEFLGPGIDLSEKLAHAFLEEFLDIRWHREGDFARGASAHLACEVENY